MNGYRHAFGVALIFSGLPLAWAFRVWFGRGDDRAFSVVLLVIALLLVTDWSRIVKGKFSLRPLIVLVPFLFVWPAMLMAWFFGRQDDISAFYLAFVSIFFLASLTLPRVAFAAMPAAFFDVALLVAFLSLGQFVLFGPVMIDDPDIGSRLFVGDSNNPNYLSFAAGLGLVAAFGEARNWLRGASARWYLRLIGIPLLIAVCVLSGTRSVLLGFGLCIVSVVIHRLMAPIGIAGADQRPVGGTPMTGGVWSLITAWVLVGASGFLLLGESLMTAIEGLVTGTVSGFDVYVAGGLMETDDSAETRTILRERVFSEFSLWGYGFDALYIDAPVLQAFYDLGLVGGIAFSLVALVVPIGWWIHVARRGGPSNGQRFPFLAYLFFLPNLLLHGRPYDFSVLLPLMLLYCTIARRDIGLTPAASR